MKKHKKKLNLGGLLQQGAGIAGMFNPAVGAGMGIAGSLINNKSQKNLMEDFFKQKNLQWDQTHVATEPTLPTFKMGGKIDASNVVKGGQLQRISKDAVEVKANNPQATDSVELDQAYVDHNEVIDKENRVFSDSIKAPSGRTVAKEAKRLEKMKSKDNRFLASNERIDGKLDELFNYQERLNAAKNKPKYANGGRIPDPEPTPKKTTIKGPEYKKVDTTLPLAQQQLLANNNLTIAQQFKNRLTGVEGNLIPTGDAEVTKILNPYETDSTFQQVGGSKRLYEQVDPRAIQQADSTINTSRQFLFSKKKLNKGGILDPLLNVQANVPIALQKPQFLMPKQQTTPDFSQVDLNPDGAKVNLVDGTGPKTAWGTPDTTPIIGKKQPNWGNIGTTAAQFAPDIINAALTTRMQKMKAPAKESRVFLDRINANDQLADNARQATNTNALIKNTTANASQALNNMGSVLAKRMYADNQVKGNVNRANADIQAKEAQMNTDIGARNVERTNAKKAADVEFQNAKLSALSQISSNVGQKILKGKQEQNIKDLSYAQLELLKKKFEDSGVYTREIDAIMEELKKKPAFKRGGKMKKC